jgi:hypothetical protein
MARSSTASSTLFAIDSQANFEVHHYFYLYLLVRRFGNAGAAGERKREVLEEKGNGEVIFIESDLWAQARLPGLEARRLRALVMPATAHGQRVDAVGGSSRRQWGGISAPRLPGRLLGTWVVLRTLSLARAVSAQRDTNARLWHVA